MLSIWDDPSRLERAPTTKELEESAANWEDLPAELVKISGTHPKFAYQWIYDRYAPLAQKAYEKNGVPVPLTLAITFRESSAKPRLKAKGPGTAYGLMQVLRGTTKDIGQRILKMEHPEFLYEWQAVPAVSIYLGTQYYAETEKIFALEDKRFAILGYRVGGYGVRGAMRKYAESEHDFKGNDAALKAWSQNLNKEELDQMFESLPEYAPEGQLEEYEHGLKYVKDVLSLEEAFSRIN